MKAATLRDTGQRVISWPPMAGGDRSGGCSGAWQRGRYRERVLLRDGRSVLLRPAHHHDAALLQSFFAELSPRSRLLRFHGAVNGLSDAAARTLSTQVASRHVALVALADGPDGLPELCAEARYAVDEDLDGEEAEFGIAVADEWQQLGLGHAVAQEYQEAGQKGPSGGLVEGHRGSLGMSGSGGHLTDPDQGMHYRGLSATTLDKSTGTCICFDAERRCFPEANEHRPADSGNRGPVMRFGHSFGGVSSTPASYTGE